MKYNEKYKILFKWNPVAQCIIGRYFGWQMVWQIYEESREYREGDEVVFTMTNGNQWDKLIKHMKKSRVRLHEGEFSPAPLNLLGREK